jgi:periplasmic protein TonB
MLTARSQAFSLGAHIVLIALLMFAASRSIPAPPQTAAPEHVTPLTFLPPPKAGDARSGGSNRTQLPAKHGSPPPTARRTFIPPAQSPHPLLALPITIAFDIPTVATSANIGDPLSRLPIGGLGANGDNGIGNHGCCGGLGESQSGPPGIAVVHGRGVTPPQLLYKVEPEFSEEARKAKYQGVVVLSIHVDATGTVRDVRVQQSLGLGLDEKAIDAVSHWRFRPGLLDGKPVVTEATVQVTFQLL